MIPVGIRRLGILMEMEDGKVMTIYSDPAPGAEVTIDAVRDDFDPGRLFTSARSSVLDITITIEHLHHYVMDVRWPRPGDFEAPGIGTGRKELGK